MDRHDLGDCGRHLSDRACHECVAWQRFERLVQPTVEAIARNRLERFWERAKRGAKPEEHGRSQVRTLICRLVALAGDVELGDQRLKQSHRVLDGDDVARELGTSRLALQELRSSKQGEESIVEIVHDDPAQLAHPVEFLGVALGMHRIGARRLGMEVLFAGHETHCSGRIGHEPTFA